MKLSLLNTYEKRNLQQNINIKMNVNMPFHKVFRDGLRKNCLLWYTNISKSLNGLISDDNNSFFFCFIQVLFVGVAQTPAWRVRKYYKYSFESQLRA